MNGKTHFQEKIELRRKHEKKSSKHTVVYADMCNDYSYGECTRG